MRAQSKVVWSEGMFVRPQHFQLQDQYIQGLIAMQPSVLGQYRYGFSQVQMNEQLLEQRKIALLSARGVLADATVFCMPEQDNAPLPLVVDESVKDQRVYLCFSYGAINRYKRFVSEVQDMHSGQVSKTEIELACLKPIILLEEDDRSEYICLAFARIKEVRPDNKIILDKDFLPVLLNIKAMIVLEQCVDEIHGLLTHRSEILAARLTHTQQSESAVIADFMLLQLANKYESVFYHLSRRNEVHPEQFYSILLQLNAEIATYTCDERRSTLQTRYDHEDLASGLQPLLKALRSSLSMVLEQHAQAISLVSENHGIYVAQINDGGLLQSSHMVLAIHADMSVEAIKQQLPKQLKISSVDEIRDLVTKGIPGVDIQALMMAPRQIPYHANFAYFEINQQHPLWQGVVDNASLALHVGGQFPNLRMELWAIRG